MSRGYQLAINTDTDQFKDRKKWISNHFVLLNLRK